MNKHTQGDWKIHEFISDNIHRINSHGICICDVYNSGNDDFAIANAHLISAAPDMLEALTQVLHDLDCMGKISDSAEIKSRAAIAKATGD